MLRALVFLLLASGAHPALAQDGGLNAEHSPLMRSYFSPEAMPTTPDQRRAMGEASIFSLRETSRVLRTSSTWQEANARLRDLADEQSDPLRRRFVESTSAYRMLTLDALTDDPSPEALDAVGHHVEALVRHQSLEMPLIVDTLDRLEGHWPAERIARTAAAALATVEEHAARRAACDGCSSRTLSPKIESATRENRATYDARSAEAIDRLRALASGDV